MKPQVILFDMDNTVCDWTKMWQEYMKEIGYDIDPSSITTHMVGEFCKSAYGMHPSGKTADIIRLPGFYRNLEPYPEAVRAIQRLQNQGHHVYFCTHPLSTTYMDLNMHEKTAWVQRYFGYAMTKNIIFSSRKWEIPGAFLVDDNPDLPAQEARAPWRAVVVTQRYNIERECPLRVSPATMDSDMQGILNEG